MHKDPKDEAAYELPESAVTWSLEVSHPTRSFVGRQPNG